MKLVFADTSYWVALLNPGDAHRRAAVAYSRQAGLGLDVVTSELVLAELLNHFSRKGSQFRQYAAQLVKRIQKESDLLLVRFERIDFNATLKLYEERGDKTWSFVDCSSFVIMERLKIQAALTSDHHFEQAGFVNLLR